MVKNPWCDPPWLGVTGEAGWQNISLTWSPLPQSRTIAERKRNSDKILKGREKVLTGISQQQNDNCDKKPAFSPLSFVLAFLFPRFGCPCMWTFPQETLLPQTLQLNNSEEIFFFLFPWQSGDGLTFSEIALQTTKRSKTRLEKHEESIFPSKDLGTNFPNVTEAVNLRDATKEAPPTQKPQSLYKGAQLHTALSSY